ncbi:hypothetical protein ACLFKX_13690 [Enterobacter hormaechei]
MQVRKLNRFRKALPGRIIVSVALKLLSPSDENAWPVMERLSQALTGHRSGQLRAGMRR